MEFVEAIDSLIKNIKESYGEMLEESGAIKKIYPGDTLTSEFKEKGEPRDNMEDYAKDKEFYDTKIKKGKATDLEVIDNGFGLKAIEASSKRKTPDIPYRICNDVLGFHSSKHKDKKEKNEELTKQEDTNQCVLNVICNYSPMLDALRKASKSLKKNDDVSVQRVGVQFRMARTRAKSLKNAVIQYKEKDQYKNTPGFKQLMDSIEKDIDKVIKATDTYFKSKKRSYYPNVKMLKSIKNKKNISKSTKKVIANYLDGSISTAKAIIDLRKTAGNEPSAFARFLSKIPIINLIPAAKDAGRFDSTMDIINKFENFIIDSKHQEKIDRATTDSNMLDANKIKNSILGKINAIGNKIETLKDSKNSTIASIPREIKSIDINNKSNLVNSLKKVTKMKIDVDVEVEAQKSSSISPKSR